jgi:archaellum component FlaG (FlaF/FlaG flagellin family)
MKRMMMMVALAAFLVAALSVSALSAFARDVPRQTFDRGQTITQASHSEHSAVKDCHHGAPNSNGAEC